MKLLIVGSDKVYAIENLYVKYIREQDCEVSLFPAQGFFYDYYHRSLLNKIIYRIGFSGILLKINRQFKRKVEEFKPECIFVFKGMELYPESLLWAKQRNIKLVNYNPDSPFIFSSRGSGNENVKSSIALYDLHLTYHKEVKREIESTFHIATEILPFGFDVDDKLFYKCESQDEVIKACFLGNPDKYRGEFLRQLAEKGIELDVYGNNWNKFVNHSHIKIFGPVLEDDFWLTLRKYRVQLNLSRPHTLNTHNMRSFEIPGIGGIQLAPQTTDHQTYFENGKEIFLYSDIDDCSALVKKILALKHDEADTIRNQARQRSLKSHYSYLDRAALALKYIRALYE